MERNLSIQLGLFVGAVLLLVLAILLQPSMEPRQHPDLVTLTNAVVIEQAPSEEESETDSAATTSEEDASVLYMVGESTFDSTNVPNTSPLETTY